MSCGPRRLRRAVSLKKRRFQEDGFDLDLAYIQDNIIAMGFPSRGLEWFYRNPMKETQRFLEKYHAGHYRIYNLCVEPERQYDDAGKFHGNVAHYPFADHNAPELAQIKDCCEDIDNWLSKHRKHVAVVHCKAGKGRTGVMVVCYLMHAGICETVEDAFEFYAKARTYNGKGVTIPSQRRFCGYYENVLDLGSLPRQRRVHLHKVTLSPIPTCNTDYVLLVTRGVRRNVIYRTRQADKSNGKVTFALPSSVMLSGDIKVELSNTKNLGTKKNRAMGAWFNTSIADYDESSGHPRLVFRRDYQEIDHLITVKGNKHYAADFSLTLEFRPVSNSGERRPSMPAIRAARDDDGGRNVVHSSYRRPAGRTGSESSYGSGDESSYGESSEASGSGSWESGSDDESWER